METLLDVVEEYRQRFGSRVRYRDAVWRVLTRDCFQKLVSEDATVLDLGAGWGEFIRHIRCGRKLAMDLNADTASRVGPGVEVVLQDCAADWRLDDDTLDVVFTSNFFEHLPDKDALRSTLQQAFRCLRPGGRLICLGPNIRLVGGGYWDFWDHLVPLSERSLAEILALVGFEVEHSVAAFLPYTMSEGFTPPIGLVAAYLRMPLAWRLFGKQFLVVARKRSLQPADAAVANLRGPV